MIGMSDIDNFRNRAFGFSFRYIAKPMSLRRETGDMGGGSYVDYVDQRYFWLCALPSAFRNANYPPSNMHRKNLSP